ncbi:MAG: MBL fold metallo-hydrolase [Gemmatimonadota bacterium]|nr:MAG: MBL fold metallo-hydrolase [Gemmatimonadota bacterium]
MNALAPLLSLGLASLVFGPSALGERGTDERSTQACVASDSVVITQLAVAGWMVSAGGRTLIIDALHRHPRHAPVAETLERLEHASPPFDEIELVLVSHAHSDHFHYESTAEHLRRNPNAVLVSGRLVHDQLTELSDFERFSDRVIVAAPEPGEVVELDANGMKIKVFRLSHGEPNADYSADNLGMIVDLCGVKVLNTGDIVPTGQTAVFRQALPGSEGVDIAFLAFTMFDEENLPEAATIIDDYIKPRYIIPSHLYEQHFGEFTKAIEDRYPKAVIFHSKGEVKVRVTR